MYNYDRRKTATISLHNETQVEEALQEVKKALPAVKKVSELAKRISETVKSTDAEAKKLHKAQARVVEDLADRVEALSKLGNVKALNEALKKLKLLKASAKTEPWQNALSVDGAFSQTMITVNLMFSGRTRSWLRKQEKTPEFQDFKRFYESGLMRHHKAQKEATAKAEAAEPQAHEIYNVVRFQDILLPFSSADEVLPDEVLTAAQEWNSCVETLKMPAQYFSAVSKDVREDAEALVVNAKEWLDAASALEKALTKAIFG